MTSIPKQRTPYRNQSLSASDRSESKQLCLIVGLVCLSGFTVDMLARGLPLSPFNLPWRIGFLQQVGDRSIVLLFSGALILYSKLGHRRLVKPLSLALLGIGLAFILSSVIVTRDSLTLKNEAVRSITNQEEQLQTQLKEGRNRSDLPENITLEQFDRAAQQVTSQAEKLKQSTQDGITKSGLASIGNLLIVGLGMIGLGRFGLVSQRKASRGQTGRS